VHREDGGSHDLKNLTLRCSACHIAHHRGLLDITGEAPDRIVTTRPHEAPRLHESSHPHKSSFDAVTRVKRTEPNAHEASAARVHVGAVPAQPGAGAPRRFDEVTMRTQARDALVRAGWKPAIARVAVDESLAESRSGASLEALLRDALRRCLASPAG
jgi:hypothetical protein